MTMAKMQGRTVRSGEKERWCKMGCERGVRKRRRDENASTSGRRKERAYKEEAEDEERRSTIRKNEGKETSQSQTGPE